MRSYEQEPQYQTGLTNTVLCCCCTVIGGIAGLAAGLGAIALPGFGPVVATVPLTVAIGGSGIGAAIGGTIAVLNAWEARASRKRTEQSRLEDNLRQAKRKAVGA